LTTLLRIPASSADKPDVPTRLSQPWIPADKIDGLLQLEPAFVILGLALGAWAIYKIFLGP